MTMIIDQTLKILSEMARDTADGMRYYLGRTYTIKEQPMVEPLLYTRDSQTFDTYEEADKELQFRNWAAKRVDTEGISAPQHQDAFIYKPSYEEIDIPEFVERREGGDRRQNPVYEPDEIEAFNNAIKEDYKNGQEELFIDMADGTKVKTVDFMAKMTEETKAADPKQFETDLQFFDEYTPEPGEEIETHESSITTCAELYKELNDSYLALIYKQQQVITALEARITEDASACEEHF